MSKRTPTPYFIREYTTLFGKSNYITSLTGVVVMGAKKEDAEFIVRACNCHDMLVTALKDTLKDIAHRNMFVNKHTIDILQEAIAKAEEK